MTAPAISIVVVVHDMAAQAMRTLQSLAVDYQRGVRAEDYEVIVVENRSARCLDAAAVAALPGQFHYLLRDEGGVSPAPAINEGLALARGDTVGLMIDGARMLTPGVVAGALAAGRAYGPALVAVPGYQLGPLPHHMAVGRTPAHDDQLLARIGWPQDGYRLFEVASMSLANRMGIFRPFMECNCLFAPAGVLAALGGADLRFDLAGGGALNLWLWHRLAHWPDLPCVVLPGEGSVHQVHGGVTTSFDAEGYRARTEAFLAQLNAVLGEPFKAPDVQVSYLGAMPQTMAPFVTYSAERFKRPGPRRAAGISAAVAAGTGAGGAGAPDAPARPPREVVDMPMGALADDRDGGDRDGGGGA